MPLLLLHNTVSSNIFGGFEFLKCQEFSSVFGNRRRARLNISLTPCLQFYIRLGWILEITVNRRRLIGENTFRPFAYINVNATNPVSPHVRNDISTYRTLFTGATVRTSTKLDIVFLNAYHEKEFHSNVTKIPESCSSQIDYSYNLSQWSFFLNTWFPFSLIYYSVLQLCSEKL